MSQDEIITLQKSIMRLQSSAINDILILLSKHGATDEEIEATGFIRKINRAAEINEDINRECIYGRK